MEKGVVVSDKKLGSDNTKVVFRYSSVFGVRRREPLPVDVSRNFLHKYSFIIFLIVSINHCSPTFSYLAFWFLEGGVGK